MSDNTELPIIQRTYDLILWYVPRINKFPRDFKFVLGDEMQRTLYGLLNGLIRARYRKEKVGLLETLNADLEVLRYQTRLSKDFGLLDVRRYTNVSKLINAVGKDLGGWIRQQRSRTA